MSHHIRNKSCVGKQRRAKTGSMYQGNAQLRKVYASQKLRALRKGPLTSKQGLQGLQGKKASVKTFYS
eukprot:511164-Pelagomonas_calceolata.AAC.1